MQLKTDFSLKQFQIKADDIHSNQKTNYTKIRNVKLKKADIHVSAFPYKLEHTITLVQMINEKCRRYKRSTYMNVYLDLVWY